MSRTDPDLIAVRDLPPGVAQPSDEAMARVWWRITARPEPVPARRSHLRIWPPVVAAAAVVLLVAGGIAALRPDARTGPAVPAFTSDRVQVAQVFAGLIAAGRSAGPLPLRSGQLIYRHDDRLTTRTATPRLARVDVESWFLPDMAQVFWSVGPELPRTELLADLRAGESAQNSRPAGPDTRPWAGIRLDAPSDPNRTLRGLLEPAEGVSAERQLWDEAVLAAELDPFLPAAWRDPLYRRLAALPVSVAETDLSGRRLVVVRLDAGAEVRDLFLDPSTGRFSGAQVILRGSAAPALSESPNHWPAWPFDSSDPDPVAGEPVEPGEQEPGVRDRTLWTWAVVEDIGQRP